MWRGVESRRIKTCDEIHYLITVDSLDTPMGPSYLCWCTAIGGLEHLGRAHRHGWCSTFDNASTEEGLAGTYVPTDAVGCLFAIWQHKIQAQKKVGG